MVIVTPGVWTDGTVKHGGAAITWKGSYLCR